MKPLGMPLPVIAPIVTSCFAVPAPGPTIFQLHCIRSPFRERISRAPTFRAQPLPSAGKQNQTKPKRQKHPKNPRRCLYAFFSLLAANPSWKIFLLLLRTSAHYCLQPMILVTLRCPTWRCGSSIPYTGIRSMTPRDCFSQPILPCGSTMLNITPNRVLRTSGKVSLSWILNHSRLKHVE